jgi:hypothetical protein
MKSDVGVKKLKILGKEEVTLKSREKAKGTGKNGEFGGKKKKDCEKSSYNM